MKTHTLTANFLVTALLSATAAFADVTRKASRTTPYGVYRLGSSTATSVSVDGVKLGSCGDDAQRVLAAHGSMTVVFTKDRDDIKVDDEYWKSIKIEDSVFARKRDTPGFLLTLRFFRKKSEAEGRLLFMRVDSDEKPVCVDALKFTGSYERQ